MVFYFSSTGNTKAIATAVANLTGEDLVKIVPGESYSGNCSDCTGRVGLAFPIHAWGPPMVVEDFISKLQPSALEGKYIYLIMTCGDDIGYSDKIAAKLLKRKGIKVDAAFSVQMPNTYLGLPGFELDSAEIQESKIRKGMEMAKHIANVVRLKDAIEPEVERGKMPFLKSYVLRPLFNTFLLSDKKFTIDKRQCIQCGMCRKACPMNNISGATSGRFPQWNGSCITCFACYHSCPKHCISYGKLTKGKAQFNRWFSGKHAFDNTL